MSINNINIIFIIIASKSNIRKMKCYKYKKRSE